MRSVRNVLSRMLSFSSHPLVSIAATLFTVALLYLPHYLLPIIFSPIPILTWTLLMAILRFGAAQTQRRRVVGEEGQSFRCGKSVEVESGTATDTVLEPNPPFVGWNVRAPLEVIYEECEGEEENDGVSNVNDKTSPPMLLSESDTDSSSGGALPGTGRWDWLETFEWDREELIGMTLDGADERAPPRIEEENLIEIDISPARRVDSPAM